MQRKPTDNLLYLSHGIVVEKITPDTNNRTYLSSRHSGGGHLADPEVHKRTNGDTKNRSDFLSRTDHGEGNQV